VNIYIKQDYIYLDRNHSKTLREKFHVNNIPNLLMFSSTCKMTVSDGVDLVRGAYHGAVRQWSKGKRLFWTREAREDEYIWDGIICHQCYMSPIIDSRHGCTVPKCYVDFCETCLPKTKHEHPLVEYLVPKRPYSFEELFKTVPHLLNPNSQQKIETKTIWENGIKCVGFYFSAHWCAPCRAFTPKLAEVYKEAQENSLPFRIVFVSSDFNEESFNEYRSEMPWPAVPFNSGHLLDTYFQSSCKYLFDFLILHKNYCSFF
jgi:thiol-disulfide isomerase/thioredoxin